MSQQNISVLALSIVAAGTLASRRLVGYDGLQASVQGQKIMGVARTDAVSGDAVPIDVVGTAVIEAGGVVAVGDAVISDNVGRAIAGAGEIAIGAGAVAMTSSAANGAILTGGELPEMVVGHALQAAAAAGDFIEVLLK